MFLLFFLIDYPNINLWRKRKRDIKPQSGWKGQKAKKNMSQNLILWNNAYFYSSKGLAYPDEHLGCRLAKWKDMNPKRAKIDEQN